MSRRLQSPPASVHIKVMSTVLTSYLRRPRLFRDLKPLLMSRLVSWVANLPWKSSARLSCMMGYQPAVVLKDMIPAMRVEILDRHREPATVPLKCDCLHKHNETHWGSG